MTTADDVERTRREFVEMCNNHIKSCELQLSGNPDIDSCWVIGTGDDPVWVSFKERYGQLTLGSTTRSLIEVYQFTEQREAHRYARAVFNGKGERGVAYRYREALEISMKRHAEIRDSVQRMTTA